MAIKKSVSNYFLSTFVNSINVFDCRLSGVFILYHVDLMSSYQRYHEIQCRV